MDPANPVRTVNDRSLTHVQRWVMSVLAVTTIMHLAVGLVVGSWFIDATGPAIGLCVIAGAFGLVSMSVGRLIHAVSPVSPWTLLGLLPGAVGVGLVLAR
jgi:hypothetical protein